MGNKLGTLLVVASATLAGNAMGQYPTQGQSALTAGFNYFTPSNGVIRDVFGTSTKFSVGLDALSVESGFKPNIYWISAHSNGNKLDIVPLGYAFQRTFGDVKTVQPYVKLGGGLDYIDYSFDLNGSHNSGKTFGYGLNAEAGFIISKSVLLSAKYNLITKVSGYDFSGLSLSASLVLAKF